jgi:hypothetical protein
MYVCKHARMYVYMHAYMYVCMQACMHICMLSMHVCMYGYVSMYEVCVNIFLIFTICACTVTVHSRSLPSLRFLFCYLSFVLFVSFSSIWFFLCLLVFFYHIPPLLQVSSQAHFYNCISIYIMLSVLLLRSVSSEEHRSSAPNSTARSNLSTGRFPRNNYDSF